MTLQFQAPAPAEPVDEQQLVGFYLPTTLTSMSFAESSMLTSASLMAACTRQQQHHIHKKGIVSEQQLADTGHQQASITGLGSKLPANSLPICNIHILQSDPCQRCSRGTNEPH